MTANRRNRDRSLPLKQPCGAFPSQQIAEAKHTLLAYIAIVLLALAVRAIYLAELSGEIPFSTLVVDALVYDAWAQEISAGDYMGKEVFYQSPLYPYFMAAIYSVGGHDPMLVRWIQVLGGSLACGLLAVAGSQFFSRRVGIVAGVLLAFYPPAIFFDGLIQKASLSLLFMSLVLALLGKFLSRPTLTKILLAGIALGLLILNRENARLMYPVVIVWLGFYFTTVSHRRRLVWMLGLTVGVGLILVPVGLRNYYVGGEFLLSTSQFGPNFYIGNHEGATGLYDPLVEGRGHTFYERADAIRLAEDAAGHSLSPAEVSDYWRDQSLDFIRSHPAEWLQLMMWKSYLVFHSVEVVDAESIDVNLRYSWLLWSLSRFQFGVLVALASFGAWATRADWRRLAILYVMLLGFAASVALFFVFARYRFPMVPILVLFSAAGLVAIPSLVQAWNKPRFWSAWGPGLVAALLLGIAFNWPLPQYHDETIAFANYGRELLEERRLPEAVEALQTALELRPEYYPARHNYATVLTLQGKVAEANAQFRHVIGQNSHYGRAHWLLGRNLSKEGQLPEAISHLRTAAALIPEESLIQIDLGQAQVASGDDAAALIAFRRALKLAPDSLLAANNLAWLLATSPQDTLRNGEEALRLVEPYSQLNDPEFLDTVAAAYAEVGQWDQALSTVRRAIQFTTQNGNAAFEAMLSKRLESYRAHMPWREPPKAK